jgi:feruloyl esterase
MVPGMFHCSGGPGPNTFDALTPLVNWVEGGVAPDTIVATKFVNDTPPAVQMTRPLYVFPNVAKYGGSGSTSIAANFTCVADEPGVATPASMRLGSAPLSWQSIMF